MPTLPGFQFNKNGPRSDFQKDELRKNIFKYGHDVTWEMANLCPCGRQISTVAGDFTIDTREKTVSCTACKGRGVIYHSSQTIKALVSDASRDPKRWAVYGEHASGMLQLTLLPEHLPGFMDRFTMTNSVMVYRERKKRSATVESLRYPIVTRSLKVGTVADPTVAETKQIGVLSCRKAGASGDIVAGELESATDFTINLSGQIDWSIGDTLGTAPSVGHYYTVQYYMNPRYVVKTFPYQFRDTITKKKVPTPEFTTLPTKVLAWLDFITGTENG